MKYITAREAAEQWSLTVRRIQDLCRSGQIPGAARWGRDWMIPADAHRPTDRRRKEHSGQQSSAHSAPKRSPAIIMTNLYHLPGSGDTVANSLSDRPKAAALFRAQLAYCRGDMEAVRRITDEILQDHCSHDLQVGCGIIRAMCALYSGDLAMWWAAKQHIETAPCHHDRDRHLNEFWSAAIDSELYDAGNFPAWFTTGNFDPLPGDSYPAARFYYLKYLYVICHESATGHRGQRDSLSAMRMLPYVAEPLISQTHKEGVLLAEIYLRMVCAVTYHNLGNDALAIHHLDTAISLALPDRLYIPLAEFRRQLDFLMDERLGLADTAAAQQVKAANKQLSAGWTELHNAVLNRTVSAKLSTREREVCKLAAYGLSNKDIADRLCISVNAVKQALRIAMDKTGAASRTELFRYI